MALVQRGYAVDLHGRDAARGDAVLDELHAIQPADHRLHLVDLTTVWSNRTFLARYLEVSDRLDLLILAADEATRRWPGGLTEDGLAHPFAVAYLSRYQFSVALDPLLRATAGARVLHVGAGRWTSALDLAAVRDPGLGPRRAAAMASIADAYLVHFSRAAGWTSVAHQAVVRARWFRGSQQREAEALMRHLAETSPKHAAGATFAGGRRKSTPRGVRRGESTWRALLSLSESVTGARL